MLNKIVRLSVNDLQQRAMFKM